MPSSDQNFSTRPSLAFSSASRKSAEGACGRFFVSRTNTAQTWVVSELRGMFRYHTICHLQLFRHWAIRRPAISDPNAHFPIPVRLSRADQIQLPEQISKVLVGPLHLAVFDVASLQEHPQRLYQTHFKESEPSSQKHMPRISSVRENQIPPRKWKRKTKTLVAGIAVGKKTMKIPHKICWTQRVSCRDIRARLCLRRLTHILLFSHTRCTYGFA